MHFGLHFLKTSGLFLLLLVLAGCLPDQADTAEITVTEALAFEETGRGHLARLDTTEVAIRDAATWAAYQDSLQPAFPFHAVDFSTEMVLLAAVPVTTGGYDLRFESVEKREDHYLATYVFAMPGSDCMTAMGQGVVFQAIRTAQFEGPLRFARNTTSYRCTE